MSLPRYVLAAGDCLEVLKKLGDNSIDALVTDPPAGISFMGKTWDKPGVLGVSGGAAMPQTTSNRNPSCKTCGGRKRAGAATKSCGCATPNWNDVEYRLADRQAFIDFMRSAAVECLRVLKPGAHGLVWALPRTAHWTTTALEERTQTLATQPVAKNLLTPQPVASRVLQPYGDQTSSSGRT